MERAGEERPEPGDERNDLRDVAEYPDDDEGRDREEEPEEDREPALLDWRRGSRLRPDSRASR